MFRRLFRAVVIGVASVFPSGDRERHWSEPVAQQQAPPGEHRESGQGDSDDQPV